MQFTTEGGLSLKKGIMLVGSNPGRSRKSVRVNAPGYQMDVKGTVQIAYYPGSYVKITVLEGTVKVALQSLTGEFETLQPGQMLIINPADKRLPEPVVVDLNRLVSTSQLVGGPFGPPSTMDLINAAIAAQGSDFSHR
jgi:ferric-dicitrate binding protein FerR (iron transport regulator)